MDLTCVTNAPIVGTHYYPKPTPVACGKPAVILILSEQEVWHAGDVQEDILTAYPYCADHAPEEVHEARNCMSPDEFTVVELPTDTVESSDSECESTSCALDREWGVWGTGCPQCDPIGYARRRASHRAVLTTPKES